MLLSLGCPHAEREMRPTGTDGQHVCQLVTIVSPAYTVKPIEMPTGTQT